MALSHHEQKLPRPFLFRRLHSILGLWLVIYLTEHLLVNSQAAWKDNGSAFIRAVNQIHDLPYLRLIEVIFLGLPFLIHGLWGIYYVWQSKPNAHVTDGSKPELPQYRKNRAYSWQRITSWLLVFAILAHVIHMRFIVYPKDEKGRYYAIVTEDTALKSMAAKLGVELLSANQLKEFQEIKLPTLKKGTVAASCPSPGCAFFLIVRDTFKSPLMVILYSIFVVAAAYHAFNGLWTFLITWGITLSKRARNGARILCFGGMTVVMLLGLWAAWGSYWAQQF